MNHYLLPVVAAVLLAGGCGENEEARPITPQTSLMKPGDPLPPTTPAHPLPVPDVPKGPLPEVELPRPGQAGDHSSSAFKGGGQPDEKK